MAWTNVQIGSQFIDRWNVVFTRSENFKRTRYQRRRRARKIFTRRFTTKTGAKPGAGCLRRRRKESYVLAFRAPRRTRGPAENTGRLHAKVEQPVEFRI